MPLSRRGRNGHTPRAGRIGHGPRRGASSRLFAYGTLCAPALFALVAGRRRTATDAALRGHHALRMHGQAWPGLVAATTAVTAGRLYCLVSAAMFRRLDAFEGRCYQRVTVQVEVLPGGASRCQRAMAPTARRTVTAQAYLLTAAGRRRARRDAWAPEALVLAAHRVLKALRQVPRGGDAGT